MRFLLFSFLLVIASNASIAQDTTFVPAPELNQLFSVKETFTYEVTYGPFKLGWVDVMLLPDTLYKGKIHKHLHTIIRSNSKNPFIGKEIDHYHSLFYENEDGIPVTSKYWKDNMDENELEEIMYEFDRENGLVYYKEEDNTRDTLDIEEPATAGHIIYYFSRIFAGSDLDSRLIVFISKDVGYINFENPTGIEKRNYRAFDEPVYAHITYGETEDLAGPFGFSGKFRAWFMNDDLRVPLEARVKVFLGNAIIKLIEYKREPI